MDKVDVKFGEWIEKGFNLYKENFGILVLVSLIAVIVSAITVGVLAGPMAAGVLLVVQITQLGGAAVVVLAGRGARRRTGAGIGRRAGRGGLGAGGDLPITAVLFDVA